MKNDKKPQVRFKGFNDDWEQRKLSDVADVRDGTHASPKYISEGHPLVTSKNVKDGFVNYDDIQYISDEDFDEINKRSKVDVNDVLIGMIGTIGNIALIRKEPDFAIKNVALIKDAKKINYLYIYHFLQSNSTIKQLTNSMDGGTQKFIALGNIRNLDIDIPSDQEQAKLGQYFESLDNLITLHQRKCDKLQKIKKSMLEKMFPQNGMKKPEIRFKGFNDDWEQRKVSETAEIAAGGTPSTSVSEYWEPKEVPWLSSGEVHKKYVTYTDDMISKLGLSNSSAKMIKENSILIALAGQGKTRGTVAINRISLSTNQSIAAMTFNDDIIPEFVFSNLENRYDEIRAMSSGDGSRGGLNKQLVGNIVIPYTIIEEQRKIGAYFENLDNLITLHQRKLEKLKYIKKSMLENMFV